MALALPIAGTAIGIGGAIVAGAIGIGAHLIQRFIGRRPMYSYQPSYDYYNDPYYYTYYTQTTRIPF
jgi:hypothetical protein